MEPAESSPDSHNRVVYFPEGEPPRLVDLTPEDLDAAQRLVDGYVEVIRLRDGLAVYCNEDGIRLEMEPNRLIPPALSGWFDPWRSTVRGPFYVSTQGDEGLTDEQINYVLHAFGETRQAP